MKPKEFLNQLQHDQIVAAIAAAEAKSSGEIRVFISQLAVEDPVAAARREFVRLGMEKTRERNGVLVFVAPKSQNFAVLGDEGVHQHCGAEFWQELVSGIGEEFKRAEFTPGIVHAVEKTGALLARFFPRQPDDQDELPNKVELG